MSGFLDASVRFYDSSYVYNGHTVTEHIMRIARIATLERAASSRHVVIFAHGNTDRYDVPADENKMRDQIQQLIDAGAVVYSVDAAGPTAWGNDSASDRVKDAVDLAIAEGHAAANIYGLGSSMGFLSIAAAQLEHDVFTRIGGTVPIISLSTIRDNNIQSRQAQIDAAYGGTYVTATERAAHDPSYIWANNTNPYGCDACLWYAPADEWQVTDAAYASNPYTDAAAADSECNVVDLGNGYTHSWAAIQSITGAELYAWLTAGTLPS